MDSSLFAAQMSKWWWLISVYFYISADICIYRIKCLSLQAERICCQLLYPSGMASCLAFLFTINIINYVKEKGE